MDFAGSPHAFRPDAAELYRFYSDWLAVALKRRGHIQHVDDIVQESYIRLTSYPADIYPTHPKAFLLKIAKNLIRDRLRTEMREAHFAANYAYPLAISSSLTTTQFESVLLKQIVATLPKSYREVFLLSRLGGLTYEEIARSQGISAKAVERRMARALALCAARMGD